MKKRLLATLLAAVLTCALAVPAGASNMSNVGEYSLVGAGGDHSAAIDANGALWTWGRNDFGQLGNGTTEESLVPVKVMEDVVSVDCGGANTAAIKSDGSLWMWGPNGGGQLGDGTTEDSYVPIKVMDDVVAVSCGGGHTAAIKTDGTLWTWGSNKYGQLGNGTTESSLTPIKIMDGATAVSAGVEVTMVIDENGVFRIFGFNTRSKTPNRSIMGNAVSGSYGGHYPGDYLVVKDDGELWRVTNTMGTDGLCVKTGFSDIKKVGGGHYGYTAMLRDDGLLMVIGNNNRGLYKQETMSYERATNVMLGVKSLACGGGHLIIATTDGSVYTWGYNGSGQLGVGNKTNYSNPQKVTLKTIPIEVPLYLNGGVGTVTLEEDEDGKVSPPQNPTRKGYTFAGWYTDREFTRLWNFNDKVTKGVALYAKWIPVSSTATKTGKSSQVIALNGNTVTLDAYTLKAANGGDVTYVKLRDIAALLESTSAKFNVDWKRGAIYVASKTAYTTKNGSELKAISGTDGSYKWNQAPVLFDGTTKALEGIVLTDGQGGGHTFFKLRDLGDAIGFTVDWTAERGIFIETK